MSRFIDAEAYIEKYECCGYLDEISVEKFNKITPTADVVEVVRCEDCMWNYIHVTPKGHDYHICRLMDLAFDNNDNFFCAYGEKKNKNAEPIPQWRGCMDGCLPYCDGKEVEA